MVEIMVKRVRLTTRCSGGRAAQPYRYPLRRSRPR
jgi:hypothetical protein